ncbi:HyaD/HybD family hydrogenase maturation endopeptidase [Novosphingobium mangrovi (ex Hu et al. 2023)]|uniref:HyaD/HybD family hydrogenase maturation endopeptidase n=1 Tax=Novosphingobium mangrovi (ex Hu et al. 2023) TaxID=2930094 RepID=A0ABT0ADG3_9SPHN|nr:HyaD/HybD family hydrogenase maturation endopeptidase [Novosphingobium mangrovi (ex Hu et al. 2023)]MCJ1961238.1 HyaD/HybD family hydrogenase maturation endopeptidase [Novosphingobium mangrovi (ex Hu et al. 2023)]
MASPPDSTPSVLVLGIGNLLWADEGFGVRAVEHMHRLWAFPDNVRLIDGGTQGVYLVQNIREADILVVFDAVDYGLEPGTMKRVEGEEVPRFLGAKKVSLHQTGFQEVLMMAEMLGDPPAHQLLIGVQPVELEDYGGSLRPQVKDKIEPAIAMALDYLAGFGIVGERRTVPLGDAESIGSLEMVLERYEGERPDAEIAPRHGDDRVLGAGFVPPADFDAEMAELVSRMPLDAGDVAGGEGAR